MESALELDGDGEAGDDANSDEGDDDSDREDEEDRLPSSKDLKFPMLAWLGTASFSPSDIDTVFVRMQMLCRRHNPLPVRYTS